MPRLGIQDGKRLRKMIEMRMEGTTYEAIGEQFELTKEAVRQHLAMWCPEVQVMGALTNRLETLRRHRDRMDLKAKALENAINTLKASIIASMGYGPEP